MNSSNQNLTIIFFLILFLCLLFSFFFFLLLPRLIRRKRSKLDRSRGHHSEGASDFGGSSRAAEELIRFEGGDDLGVADILDAPGEVIGKSPYGTLYEASVAKSGSSPEVMVLRFLRPVCAGGGDGVGLEEVGLAARAIGAVRHANVVPLRAVYVGPRGEMLLVHPFYDGGNLAHFLADDSVESYKWEAIYAIAYGIAKGLDHLHTGSARPIIHGNLKSKNILLDGSSLHPYISDHGLHLLLNPATAGQELLEASALQGYKAPELVKIVDVCESTDIYSLGVVLLELLTRKRPINVNPSSSQEIDLPSAVRSAVLRRRVTDLYHPGLLNNVETSDHRRQLSEDRILKLVQLAISCCSPSPLLRPPAKEVVRKIEEIGR